MSPQLRKRTSQKMDERCVVIAGERCVHDGERGEDKDFGRVPKVED